MQHSPSVATRQNTMTIEDVDVNSALNVSQQNRLTVVTQHYVQHVTIYNNMCAHTLV